LRRLMTGVGPYAFRGVSVRRLWLYLPDRFGRSVHPCRRELKKWSAQRATSSGFRRTATIWS
jgi:hypothetical protein